MLNEKLPQYDHSEWKAHILPLRAPSVAEDSDHLTPQQVLEDTMKQYEEFVS
jgi:acetolactate synthase-1/2/3 large subunit